jgi:RNA polymerase-binding transcription factor DksA
MAGVMLARVALYGASIQSGQSIPDERLEAFPLGELTVDKAATRDRDQVREE